MRRALLVLGFLALGGGLLAGCPAAHSGYPTTDCKTNQDCYQGETCVMNTCTTVQPDLSVPSNLPIFNLSEPTDGGADGGGDR